MRTLRRLLFGETWLVPGGVAAVLLAGGLVVRELLPSVWERAGGFFVLAGVLGVLLVSVARS